MNKTLFACLAMSLLSSIVLPAMAADAKPKTAQQERMTRCNADAKTQALVGDARKTFMSSCLKGETAAPAAKMTQQQKMSHCNAEAKTQALSGDARKTFMSGCLKAQ